VNSIAPVISAQAMTAGADGRVYLAGEAGSGKNSFRLPRAHSNQAPEAVAFAGQGAGAPECRSR